MNKNIAIVAGAIIIVGITFASIVYYNHQGDLNLKTQQLELEKQKEQTKIDTAKKDAEKAASESFSNSLQYSSCISQADIERTNNLKINSQYETTDSNGGVVYNGNATVFAQIEAATQQEKTRCSTMYQN